MYIHTYAEGVCYKLTDLFTCFFGSNYVAVFIHMYVDTLHPYVHTNIRLDSSVVEILSTNFVACASCFNLLVHTDWLSHKHTDMYIHMYINTSMKASLSLSTPLLPRYAPSFWAMRVPVCVLVCMYCIWCFFHSCCFSFGVCSFAVGCFDAHI